MEFDMKTARALSVLAGAAGLLVVSAFADTVNFDDLPTGAPPPGWTATQTGKGEAKWAVVADASAPSKPNVLKQSGEATFPVCFKNDTSLKDGFVEVKFKPVSGKEDRAGGLVWRCQDADNYYVARANALEDNVTIYHVIKGRRTSFKNTDTKVASGVWHTLRVEFEGNQFTVILDGKQVIAASDDSFMEPGKVGVWTKADSVTLFDDFSYGSK
jgi:3-keto-disaccharide hydrolase